MTTPLSPGTRLGPYEIVAPIGAGGMGEVWRARDTRLERTVAIKVLPSSLSANAQLKLRFEREAKTISQLTHPHICTLFDVGHEAGVDFLVMEHLEGESLAERLTKGPLPFDQVLRIGAEIAEALERAHRAGVVHRDLKPANVMLTRSGAKLLDFGLAKSAPAFAPAEEATVQKSITQEGTIVGTFQYMAPEQIEGREADARTDLFALGAVLYEMATGKRAFEAKSRASLIAAILDREPEPISAVQPLTPATFEHIVSRCLAKDPDDRWQTAHDVRLQLEWLRDSRSGAAPAVAARGTSRDRVAWTAFALALLAAAGFAAMYVRKAAERPRVISGAIPAPPKNTFSFRTSGAPPAVSPDGTKVVFGAIEGGVHRLWLRDLSSDQASPIAGTEGGAFPFWAPDGEKIGFFADRKLKKLALDGSPPVILADVSTPRGGSWHGDTILIGGRYDVVYKTSASGGKPVPLTKLGTASEASHRWPIFSPEGTHFLYLSTPTGSESPNNAIWVAPIDRPGDRKQLLQAATNVAIAGDYLVFVRDRALVAQKLDRKSWTLTGETVPIAPAVAVDSLFSRAMFDAVEGTVVLQKTAGETTVRLTSMDRKGGSIAEIPVGGAALSPTVSPNGDAIAVTVHEPGIGSQSIWIVDRKRGTARRLTFGTRDINPVWSPDGKSIIYATAKEVTLTRQLVRIPAGGGGSEETIVQASDGISPTSWSPDGRYVVANRPGNSGGEIWLVSLEDRTMRPVVQQGVSGTISRDGRWLAYASDESGLAEVYLTQFPSGAGKWQVTNGGGRYPRWSRDGSRLYYVTRDDALAALPLDLSGPAPEPSPPERLFAVSGGSPFIPYDEDRDGMFVVSRPNFSESGEPLQMIVNWQEKLRRR